MKHDVEIQISHQAYDKLYKEHYAAKDEAEMEKVINESIVQAENVQNQEGDDPLTDLEKEVISKKARFTQMGRAFHAPKEREIYNGTKAGEPPRASSAMSSVKGSAKGSANGEGEDAINVPPYDPLVPEQWLERIQEFRTLHLIKFPRIWQSLIYLLKFEDQSAVCERDTNKLSWKKTKEILDKGDGNSVFKRLNDYCPFGPKEDEYKEYQKLLFIKENIDSLNEEVIHEHSAALGKLYYWIVHAIELRINDVVSRRQQKTREREQRQEAQDREAERLEKREEALAAAKEKFELENE